MLNWLLTLEEPVMLQTVSRLLPELPLFLMTAVATHLVMSFAQTLMHYKLGHCPIGSIFFRNHINFHHTYYSKDHLVSRTYLGDEGNNTPFFFIPVFLVGACTYFLLPFDLFVVQIVACAASFYAHVFFDKEYHVDPGALLAQPTLQFDDERSATFMTRFMVSRDDQLEHGWSPLSRRFAAAGSS